MTTTATLALHLADNVHAIARIDQAGQFYAELRHAVDQIERCINRPPAPRFCGQCDTMLDRKMCGVLLYAPRDAVEVGCPNPECCTVHNIEKLYARWLDYADGMSFPREILIGNQRTDNAELYHTGIMGGLDEFVPWQSFNRWIREHHLYAATYVQADGRRSTTRNTPSDIPEYRLADVRRIRRTMDRKTPKAKTA
jgi:hypothetical protein